MADEAARADEATFLAAVRERDVAVVESMLAARPELAVVRDGGTSAILLARYHGQHAVRGADPTLRDDNGLTAADHARQRGHVPLAARLS